MTVNQLSVFVENKQGRLSEITSILQQNQVDIRALSIADTTHFGILRLIVDKPAQAETALKEAGFTVSLTPVIAIGVADRPGGRGPGAAPGRGHQCGIYVRLRQPQKGFRLRHPPGG